MVCTTHGSVRRRAVERAGIAALLAVGLGPLAATAVARAGARAPSRADAPIVAVSPARFWNTGDDGITTVDGRLAGTPRTAAGDAFAVPVAGRGDVPADATAAVVNLTVTGAGAAGSAVVFPCGRRPPAEPLLAVAPDDVRSNVTIVELGAGGDVCVSTDVVADVALDVSGYVPAGSSFGVFSPTRVLDTTERLVATALASPGATGSFAGTVAAGQTVEVDVVGRGGVPADASTVFVNVTAGGADADGSASVFPCDAPPAAAAVDFRAGDIAASSAAVVVLSRRGTLCVTVTAAVELAIDVVGSVPDDVPGARIASGAPLTAPTRVGAGETVEVDVSGDDRRRAGTAAAFVTMRLERIDGPGTVTLSPCGERPAVATVTIGAATVGRTVTALTPLPPGGTLCVSATMATDVRVGLAGLAGVDDAAGDEDPSDAPPGTTTGAVSTTAVAPTNTAAPTTTGPSVVGDPAPPTTPIPTSTEAADTTAPGTTASPATTMSTQPAGCDPDETVSMNITGLVRLPDGQQPAGVGALAVLRDHALNPGGVFAEASVNDAGFFLLNVDGVPGSPGCPKNYTIEVSVDRDGVIVMFAELDVTDLFIPAVPGGDTIEADITSTPIVLQDTAPPPTTVPPGDEP